MRAGEIDLPAHQPFVDIAAEAADHFEEHVGKLGTEARDQRRRQEISRGRRHGEGDHAGRTPAAAALDLGLGLLELAERHLAALQQDTAGVCEAHAVAVPLEKRVSELLLELADLPAHRRLRDAQELGAAAVAAELRDGLEIAERAGFQRRSGVETICL